MEKIVTVESTTLSYNDVGTGPVVLLLHGYLETKSVWDRFAQNLAEQYRVIAPDIPGHGGSGTFAETHTMEALSQKINALLCYLKIDSCAVIGHSMGGYVMMALAAMYPERVTQMVILHSSIFADSDEKKANRLHDIGLIENGHLELIINSAVPNTFANENLPSFKSEIETLKAKALQTNPNGVIALLKGMMARADQQEFMRSYSKPLLFIFGQKDNFISLEMAQKMVAVNPLSNVIWLEKSGHMGFIEQEQEVLTHILSFLN